MPDKSSGSLKARSDETRAKSQKSLNAPRLRSRSLKAQESGWLKYLLLGMFQRNICSDNEVPCAVWRFLENTFILFLLLYSLLLLLGTSQGESIIVGILEYNPL